MPLAATQEGEASGSRASAPRRGRSSTAAVAAMPTTRAQSRALTRTRRKSPRSHSAQEPLVRSKRSKRKRKAAGNQRSNKRKRTREEEEEREEEVSSAGSSPLRVPYIPDEMYLLRDLDLGESIMKAHNTYSAKLARQNLLPTLNTHRPPTCMVKDPKFLPVRESTTRTVLSAAPSVLGLSSSVGGHPLTRCSGFWVDWDEEKKVGTLLTSAHVIRTKSPSLDHWLGKDEYDRNAEVFVHLRDDPTEKKGHQAHLLYYQKHYSIALFEVRVDQPLQLLHIKDDAKCGEEVFELGRDESSFLTIRNGMVQYRNSNLLEGHHYLYVHGTKENLKYDNGGPVIDLDGKVVGMVSKSTNGSFIPSSVLLKCLHLWKKFGCIPRPQLGLKFSAIKFLDPPLIENILCKCNIADGLIVQEVSEGSTAEKLGFRLGDVVECLNGERISTTVELENVLLSMCKDGISGLNSEVDLEIGVFHVRRKLWRSKKLNVKVSDDSEVIVRGVYYPFGEGTSSPPVEEVSP